MSDEVAVSAENVSKRFVLHRNRAGDLRELFTGLWRKGNKSVGAADNAFYALRDVGFSIQRGETVGIVGHNGSGKSTLLKMLTGILKPDTGHIQTHGRIGALIEVGAGFHPDLSGRENVYLNGSIMGLSRRELEKKFDAIVAFAGLERFIDTPVKRYSSGMYMRLGFAIATHIEPEILLIDEVLAVGDTQFQNKCVKHLREFAGNGGTVVFVSHAMEQVAGLCERCLWLDRGQLLHDGPTTDAIDKYMAVVAEREDEEFKQNHPEEWEARESEKRISPVMSDAELSQIKRDVRQKERLGNPTRGRIIGCSALGANGEVQTVFNVVEGLIIQIRYELPYGLPRPVFCLEIYRTDGLHMFSTNTQMHGLDASSFTEAGTVCLDISSLMLNTGEYRVQITLFSDWAGDDTYLRLPYDDQWETATTFHVDGGVFGGFGCTYIPATWHLKHNVMKESKINVV